MIQPMAYKLPPSPIQIEYDVRNGRTTKRFEDHFEARRFYLAKSNAGQNPRVHRADCCKLEQSSCEESEEPMIKKAAKTTARKPAPKAAKTKVANTKQVKTQAPQVEKPEAEILKEEKPKPTVPQKVQPRANTRAYFAGQVLKKHGLDKGITDEMIAELDELYGRPNFIESRSRLVGAWHSLRGYLEEVKR